MRHFILLTLTLLFSRSFGGGNYCNVEDGNRLHLICNPANTQPIHIIKNDSVSCSGFEASLKNIKTIDIATCTFDDFNSFGNFTKLRFSFFHDTKSIRKETFIGLNQLTYISVGYSNAEVLDAAFSDSPSLRTVHIYSNNLNLKALAFQGAHQLKSVSLSDFSMASLPNRFFSDLTNLEYLSLGHSQFTNLSSIDFTGLVNVKWLDLNLNRISNLTGNLFDIVKNLKYLNLGNNRIADLDTVSLSDFRHLVHLNLEGNQIGEVNGSTFNGLNNLRSLKLYNNYIRIIEEGSFSSLNNLKTLDLSNNRLTAVDEHTFKGMDNLQHLNLEDNIISVVNIDAFKTLTKLIELDMSSQHGELETIDLNAFPQFIDMQTKTLIANAAASEPDDFEKNELQWIKDSLSLDIDFNGDISYYHWKFFGSSKWLQNDNHPIDLNNLSQNISSASLVFGNLDLSKNRFTSVNIEKSN